MVKPKGLLMDYIALKGESRDVLEYETLVKTEGCKYRSVYN